MKKPINHILSKNEFVVNASSVPPKRLFSCDRCGHEAMYVLPPVNCPECAKHAHHATPVMASVTIHSVVDDDFLRRFREEEKARQRDIFLMYGLGMAENLGSCGYRIDKVIDLPEIPKDHPYRSIMQIAEITGLRGTRLNLDYFSNLDFSLRLLMAS